LDSVPETLQLVRDVGLDERIQVSDDRARTRFIFRNGRLHELPGGPLGFARSGLLSWPGKIRVAFEPFATRRPDDIDETIHAFAARRIGREAADILIDSMVSGVFGGNARELSLRACFPKMWQMETDHGGLFRALLAKMREKKKRRGEAMGAPAGRLTSFKGGSEELIQGVAGALDADVRTNAWVEDIHETAEGYGVALQGGDTLTAHAVVLATGASAAAANVASLDDGLAATLRQIPCAPIVVACLGWERERLGHDLDGFGFLIPRGEGPRTLGVLWDSSIYPGRAPEGHVLVRVMIGGASDPDAVDLDDDTLLHIIRRDLQTTMRVDAEPSFSRIFRHRLGIPQYRVGHGDKLARIEARLANHPGLYVTGNSYRGVAINSCIAEAGPLAERIASEQLQ
jgi:oxygen-dependent protoporphyrinogen oxidase